MFIFVEVTMPKDKSKTLEKIIPSAKREFLEKGFANASMRSIAAGAGITAAGLYCHFDSKEAMFEALVSPVYTDFIERYRAEGEKHFRQLTDNGMDPMWESSGQTMGLFMEYMYAHLDEFRLLISCSEQTPYEHFTHSLIELDIEMTLRYLEMAKGLGYPVQRIGRRELHILSNAQFSCIFEMILHDVPKEEAMRMAERFSSFFAAGWKEVLLR